MREYNGFSDKERDRVGRQQAKAIRNGEIPAPHRCELCLASPGPEKMQIHNEDYARAFGDMHPICLTCHRALHNRFTNPSRWLARLAEIRSFRKEPAEPLGIYWWERLEMEESQLPILNPAHPRFGAAQSDL